MSTATRSGKPLDAIAVHGWLVRELDGLPRSPPEVTQFRGGASNLTYLLRYPDRELVLRRPPQGARLPSAHDVAREARFEAAIKPVFPLAPTVRALCLDPDVIGVDFFVMDRVPGIVPRATLPANVTITPNQARELSERFVDALVDLHSVDPCTVDFAGVGLTRLRRGPGYTGRQVGNWTERYSRVRTPNTPTFELVCQWLAEHVPTDADSCIIHNDYRLDNLVLGADDLRINGVLDWEMGNVGDPFMDLGNAMAYWTQATDPAPGRSLRMQPSHLPGMLTRREVVERYCKGSGRAASDWPFYETFGLFRLAVILQQFYTLYYHRRTRARQLRNIWRVVSYLDWRCRQAMHGTHS